MRRIVLLQVSLGHSELVLWYLRNIILGVDEKLWKKDSYSKDFVGPLPGSCSIVGQRLHRSGFEGSLRDQTSN